jgi:L-methionine (R)-S-oxide reductase
VAEAIVVSLSQNKQERYASLLPQIAALVTGETDLIANMANIASALHFGMNFFWVGFYLVKEDELVLGPFQGPVACTRIKFGRGVCGTAWQKRTVIIVEDVDSFPGHIACSSNSRSEIVVPLWDKSGVMAVLDVDSDKLNDFDEVDEKYLLEIVGLIGNNREQDL